MSDEEKVSSLFDLKYHELATVRKVNSEHEWTKVLRVPNGFIYIVQTSQQLSTSFVPEYIPMPPQQKDDSDLLDAEICDFLNKIMTDALLIESGDSITANKLVRAILKRQKGE